MRFHYNTDHGQSFAWLRYPADKFWYGLLMAMLVAAPFVLPKFYVGELAYLYILCIASLGLMTLTGWTGQVSLGHAAFIGIGAYAHALLLAAGWPWLLSLVSACALAAAAGVAIGLPAIRVSGLYLAMVTLAFSFVVEHVLGRWKSLTGGYNGMAVPDVKFLGLDLGALRPFYFVCLALLVIVLLLLANLARSRTGRAFTGVRDSESAAHALGIWVAGHKVLAFAISAGVCGLAGALLTHHLKFLTPEAFGLLLSMELVLAVVIGGLGSLHGAIYGGALIAILPAAISLAKPLLPARIAQQSGLEIFVFGLVLVLFVLFEPRGLYGRWLKLRTLLEWFPLYRRDTFRRGKTYMKSERYR